MSAQEQLQIIKANIAKTQDPVMLFAMNQRVNQLQAEIEQINDMPVYIVSDEISHAKHVIQQFVNDGLQLDTSCLEFGRQTKLFTFNKANMHIEIEIDFDLNYDGMYVYGVENIEVIDGFYIDITDAEMKEIEPLIWAIIENTPQTYILL